MFCFLTRKDGAMNFLETKRLRVAYKRFGDSNAPAIILVHGWPDDATTWNAVTPALVAKGFQCFTPYLRGFGETRFLSDDIPRSGQLASLGQDLIEFIEGLNLGAVHLVGHDWGARAVYNATALRPDLVRTLVTLSVGYGTNHPEQLLSFEQTRLYWYHWLFATERGRRTLLADRRGFTKDLWKLWSPGWLFRDEEFETTAQSFDNPDWLEITLDSYRNRWGNSPDDPYYDDINQKLMAAPKITVPTTLLHGEADGATLPETSANKEQFFTNVYKRIVLKGVGHFIQRESPQIVIDEVLARVTSKF
jgi:pimeloyl-ACP methyl ester carboxylesterase